MGCDGSIDIAKGFQADPEIDVRLCILGSPRHGLPIQFAGPYELTTVFGAIAFGNKLVDRVNRCGQRIFFRL